MQFKLSESERHRDRALDDVARMEKKLTEVSSGHGQALTDTKKQLWELEDKVVDDVFRVLNVITPLPRSYVPLVI